MKDLVSIGKCSSPHGIKGGFSLKLYNPDSESLSEGSKIFCLPLGPSSQLDEAGEWKQIEKLQGGSKKILYLEGIHDRNLVESLLPFEVSIDKKELPKLQEGEFYLEDLIGLKVLEHESKKEVGHLESFYENGAQVVFVIKGEETWELPFVDAFFPVVDIENKSLEVILPEIME